ncbi:immunity 53 family protein [Streptomyces avicenniae]|uniref:immunity 53 family protein n=1 Tax=Streptomyces avicenniae TaxID=500153 RepID=UPI00069C5F87|nr:immunity 53 family protein [Streptomyces avicenniae]
MGEALSRLQEWYSSACDGDWEHEFGISIQTLDNPGWSLEIDLSETPLEGRRFACKNTDSESSWFFVESNGSRFNAACDPHSLERVIEIFLTFAEGDSSSDHP